LFEGIQKRRIIGPRYIDKNSRPGSFSNLAAEEAGAYDEEESLAAFAISQLSPREREIALKVYDCKQQLTSNELFEFAALEARLQGMLDEQEWQQLFIAPHLNMQLQSFVVYYTELRQLRSLTDYRAIATRATRILGRPAKVYDLFNSDFAEQWISGLRTAATKKIANAIVSAASRLVMGQTRNEVNHPIYWSQSQVDNYIGYVDGHLGESWIGAVRESDFWSILVLLARDLGLPLEALKRVSSRHLCAQPSKISSRCAERISRIDVGLDYQFFSGLSPNVLHRRHKQICWQSSSVRAALTSREYAILKLCIEGFSKKQIQKRIGLSYEQLKHSRMRILKIRNALPENEGDLVADAIRCGFDLTPNSVPGVMRVQVG
jgi:DNA-binding CsgD family transcriptional regulator